MTRKQKARPPAPERPLGGNPCSACIALNSHLAEIGRALNLGPKAAPLQILDGARELSAALLTLREENLGLKEDLAMASAQAQHMVRRVREEHAALVEGVRNLARNLRSFQARDTSVDTGVIHTINAYNKIAGELEAFLADTNAPPSRYDALVERVRTLGDALKVHKANVGNSLAVARLEEAWNAVRALLPDASVGRDKLTPAIRTARLARMLHYLECKRLNLYDGDHWIDTAWAADGKNRGGYHDRAADILRAVAAIDSLSDGALAADITRALAPKPPTEERPRHGV